MKNFREYKDKSEKLLLEISTDKLSAYLTILNDEEILDESHIQKFIEDMDITSGFEAAAEYNKKNKISKQVGKRFLIAKAILENDSPELQYAFDKNNCINPNQEIKSKSIGDCVGVIEGQKLAEVKEGIANSSGANIFGEKIENTGYLNVEDRLGENVYFDADADCIRAEKNGYVFIDQDDQINLKHDIYIKENIENADLKLFGNVTIKGVIQKSGIEVKGNLSVFGNITNCFDKGFCVDGDIALAYADKSRILAGGSIKISNTVDNCLIAANKEIIGLENSSVVDSLMQSGESIEMARIGNSFSQLTELEITFMPFEKYLLASLQKQLDSQAYADGDKLDKIREELASKKEEFLEKLEIYLSRDTQKFQITALNQIYENTFFRILNYSLNNDEKQDGSIVRIQNDTLEINAIDRI